MRLAVISGTVALALAATPAPRAIAADDPQIVQFGVVDALTRQQAMAKRGAPDLSAVYVARLKFADSQQVDVTSLSPSVIGRVDSATGPALTLIRFSKDRNSLEFFSRDPVSGRGALMVIPVADAPRTVTFPVLENGKLVPTEIVLVLVVHQP